MSERKLATVRKIADLQPIPNADRIEVATVDGWQCVVKKGEFKVGDLCIYIEIDSVLPNDIPYWSFMADRKFRVKTIRLRKQISQGLCIPLKKDEAREYVPKELRPSPLGRLYVQEGSDVTDELGIEKYLSPSERESDCVGTPKKKHNWFVKFMTRFSWYRKLTKTRSKSFPDWISKTDEERIQNCPWVLTKYADKPMYVTEKLDGQSATYWYKRKLFGGEFGICSRTVRKFEWDGSNWSKVAKMYDIKKKLKSDFRNIAIQGEIVGPKIQGNKLQRSELEFYVFNVYDIDKRRYFNIAELLGFCDCKGLKHVPLLDVDFKLPATVAEMVEYSKGKSTMADVEREGVVVRSHDKSVSFKAVSPDFLLNSGE